MADPTWDIFNPASKPRLLAVLHNEADAMFGLVAHPDHWHMPTACEGWEVRDMVGHLVDAMESYLEGFRLARTGAAGEAAIGMAGMAKASDEAARAFRAVDRDELLERFHRDFDRLLGEFETLTDDDWSQLLVPDRYLGPLPAMIVAAGLLGGFTVHGWDVRQGLGSPHAIASDAADLLVPFTFLLWSVTADTSRVHAPYSIGIRTTGKNGGETRFDVAPDGIRFASASVADCEAILEYDPGTLVLTGYARVNGGTVHGDPQVASDFRSLFVSI
jgi:uncharacterized protein (TIGR03083 family)